MSRRLASNFREVFPRDLHVFDHHDGRQYPYRIFVHHLVCRYPGDDKCGPHPIVAPLDYETDFASIPTRALKAILDRSKFVKCSKYIPGLDWAVWVWRDFRDGLGPRIVGYRISALAYCAVVHDILCSTEAVGPFAANRIFRVLMDLGAVPNSRIIYAGVQVGCWVTYLQHNPREVREDREMARKATLDWIQNHEQRFQDWLKTDLATAWA